MGQGGQDSRTEKGWGMQVHRASEPTKNSGRLREAILPVSARLAFFDRDTGLKLIDYSMEVENLVTPDQVLNRLDEIVSEKSPIRVLGANRFAAKAGD